MDDKKKMRSQNWFGKTGKDGFIYRAWMKNQGYPADEFEGKPVIGICNTWSELTPCNGHFRELAEHVKRGVWEAGGFPLEFPVMSLGETLMKPTTMLYRNLASMDAEESIRGNPLDGIVLLGGCDKTTPSILMGACSVDLPTIFISGGPMLNGKHKGRDIGTTDVWKFSDANRRGELSQKEFVEAEANMCRSDGHCAVMGTASTMACMVEALGVTLPHNAAIPASDSRRKVLAHISGRRIVDMVKEDLTLSKILTREAFENAIMVNAAIGGSTNFVVHLLAIAGRIGVKLDLEDFDKFSEKIPLLANLLPSGKFMMEDFYYAGGLPALIKELKAHLHTNALTANGKSIGENTDDITCYDTNVISSLENPFKDDSGIAVVRGNLCPDGAILKPSAATPALMQHKGRAFVFEDIEDYKAKVDLPDLDLDENSVLVLKNAGPKGYPGMPEVGNIGLPKMMLDKGITDMVRISDGRMSGTAFGTVILHVSPESAVGGTFGLVETGDIIELDVANRKLTLHVSDEVLAERKKSWKAPDLGYNRGYAKMYIEHVEQAHEGVDLDFLKGKSGSEVNRDSH
ncbi:MAG: L-arabonate dehydrase [Flavobacteriales bacterium]|jgi:L-arabonate dehydrase